MNPQSTITASMSTVQLIAVHSYCSTDATHLRFPAHATLRAKPGQEGNSLWYGSYKGRSGWFPVSYCRLQRLQLAPSPSSHRRRRVKSFSAMDFTLFEEEAPDICTARTTSLTSLESRECMHVFDEDVKLANECSPKSGGTWQTDSQSTHSPLQFSSSIRLSVPGFVEEITPNNGLTFLDDERIELTRKLSICSSESSSSISHRKRHRWFRNKPSSSQDRGKDTTESTMTPVGKALKAGSRLLWHSNSTPPTTTTTTPTVSKTMESTPPVKNVYIVNSPSICTQDLDEHEDDHSELGTFQDEIPQSVSEDEIPTPVLEEPEDPIELWAAALRHRHSEQALF